MGNTQPLLPGARYRHYKGNEYTLLHVARHSETLEEMIIYRAEYGEGGVWARPKEMFFEDVTVNGQTVPRFAYLARTSFRPADAGDANAVLALYRSLLGLPGVTWNENYPSAEDVCADITAGRLILMEENGTLIGAAALLEHDDLETLPVWNPALRRPAIPVRVGVARAFQRHGFGTLLMRHCISLASAQGYDCIRLLAAQGNTAACALYRSLGFAFVGETEMYGNRYFCCECPTDGNRW